MEGSRFGITQQVSYLANRKTRSADITFRSSPARRIKHFLIRDALFGQAPLKGSDGYRKVASDLPDVHTSVSNALSEGPLYCRCQTRSDRQPRKDLVRLMFEELTKDRVATRQFD